MAIQISKEFCKGFRNLSEILENMAYYLPLLDGYFLQMEDEIAPLAAIIGASWNDRHQRTSGPC